MIHKLMQNFHAMLERQDSYFAIAHDEIRDTNLQLLKILCILEMLFLTVYIMWTPLLFPTWRPTISYWVFLGCSFLLSVVVYVYSRRKTATGEGVMKLCVLFYVLTLIGCIAIDVVPNPSQPSIYFHIIMVVLPSLFILPLKVMFPLTASLELIYIPLLFAFKDPWYAKVDAYSASVGFFCSVIVMTVVSNLRAREGVTKYFYIRVGTVDSLTQVMSRREFENQAKAFFTARKDEESSCALLMLDIDRFKTINDEYGHQVGDEVLSRVGAALNGCFRSQDLVGRIGGDEFMVLIPSLKESGDLKEIADRIRKSFSEIHCLPDQQTITASIGIAVPKGLRTYEEMYRSADQAMYQAKNTRAGLCCQVICEPER